QLRLHPRRILKSCSEIRRQQPASLERQRSSKLRLMHSRLTRPRLKSNRLRSTRTRLLSSLKERSSTPQPRANLTPKSYRWNHQNRQLKYKLRRCPTKSEHECSSTRRLRIW